MYRTRKNCYYIYVKTVGLEAFTKKVGFRIPEKVKAFQRVLKRPRRWKKWDSSSTRKAVLELRKRGLSYRQIAKELGVPKTTIQRRLKGSSSFEEYQDRRRREG